MASLLADAANLPAAPLPSTEAFDDWLAKAGLQVVGNAGWRAIDNAERELGAVSGRDRTTIQSSQDLLRAAQVI